MSPQDTATLIVALVLPLVIFLAWWDHRGTRRVKEKLLKALDDADETQARLQAAIARRDKYADALSEIKNSDRGFSLMTARDLRSIASKALI